MLADLLSHVGYKTRWGIGLAIIAVLLIFFVFPTRSLLAQRSELQDSRQELRALDEQNRRLELERQKLQTAEEIEKIARSLHNMIMPGETPYVVVPSAPPVTTTTLAALPATTAP